MAIFAKFNGMQSYPRRKANRTKGFADRILLRNRVSKSRHA